MAATLAKDLWAARMEGDVVAVAPAQEPASVAAAYEVQAAMARRAGLAQVGGEARGGAPARVGK